MINAQFNKTNANAIKIFFVDIAHRIAMKRADFNLQNINDYKLYHDEVVSILAEQLAAKVANEFDSLGESA